MTVYISGPITEVDGYMELFEAVEARLKAKGYEVINPAKVNAQMPPTTTYEGYMDMSLAMIKQADAIYLLYGFEKSIGAMREYWFAIGAGMKIMKEGEDGAV